MQILTTCIPSVRTQGGAKLKIKGELRELADRAASPVASPRTLRLPLPSSPGAVLELGRSERLGAGGSGLVFKGWRVSRSGTRSAVAVKTLPFGATAAEGERFRAEIRLLREAASCCAGVCRLMEEPLEHEGRLHLVMKLYAGSVADLLRREGALSARQTAGLCAQVAAGLAELHGLHPAIAVLDLKPANLLVETDGGFLRVVIADFGVARRIQTVSEQPSSRAGSGIAGSGIAGTPGFMAPEQYDRQLYGRPGLAADVWALGCVAVVMLTGSARPWPADWTPLEIMTQVAMRREVPEPPPSAPPGLAALLGRCLAHRPTERPAAAAAAAELRGIERDFGAVRLEMLPRNKLSHQCKSCDADDVRARPA
eukprot:SAG11_NODE_2859_length_2899_cov_4.249643_3_plen_369_part_00